QRADRRLVGLDEQAAHVRVGGQEVLRELEGLVGGVALHLLQAGFLAGEAAFLQAVEEALGAGLAVLADLRDGDDADRTALPALCLRRRGERDAGVVGALVVVGGDEGGIVAAIGADIADDDRDIGLLGEGQYARRRRGIGRRDDDAGDAAGDRILRVAQLRL